MIINEYYDYSYNHLIMWKDKIIAAIVTGTGIACLAIAAATIYSNHQTLKQNKMIHEDNKTLMERNQQIEIDKIELDKFKLGLPSKFDQYRIDTLKVQEDLKVSSEYKSIQTELNTPQEVSSTIQTESNLSLNVTANLEESPSIINSVFEPGLIDVSSSNILQYVGFSVACFAFIGLVSGICLGLNFFISNFGNKFKDKFPKQIQYLFYIKDKYLVMSNTFYILCIIISQSISLLYGLYFYFFGAV